MKTLPLRSAQAIVRKTWSIGKPTKSNFIKAVKATCPSRKNFDELFSLLKPFVNRIKKIDELDTFLLKKSENQDNKKETRKTIYQKGKEQFDKKFGDKIPWYAIS